MIQTKHNEALTVRMWYGTVPNAELAKRIGKPVEFVESEAERLGLAKPKSKVKRPLLRTVPKPVAKPVCEKPRAYNRLSADEKQTLLRLYPVTDTGELAKMMNRSAMSITKFANIAGLHKTPAYMESLAQRRADRRTSRLSQNKQDLVAKLKEAYRLIKEGYKSEALSCIELALDDLRGRA
jgi:hypothetical protein